MKRTINLGKVFGVPVRMHYTWFIALVLISLGVAIYFRGTYPLWKGILLGAGVGVLFFASMFAREFAHSYAAINRGVSVKSITLYVFGGVPRITDADTRLAPELIMAAVGPLSSFIIAGVFYSVHLALAFWGNFMYADLVRWLFFFNIMMALFNLIPGFPLDGGRFLRAILWKATGDYSRATRIATLTGRGIGYLLIIGGAVEVVIAGQWFTGLALVAGGWFLENAAAASYRQALLREALRGVTARYLMTEDYTPIKQQLTIGLARDYIINSGQQYFVIIEDGTLLGIVTLSDIRIPKELWGSTTISQVMTPSNELKTANPNQPAVDLLEEMDECDVNQIPVLEKGRLIGMVIEDSLIRLLAARAKLKA